MRSPWMNRVECYPQFPRVVEAHCVWPCDSNGNCWAETLMECNQHWDTCRRVLGPSQYTQSTHQVLSSSQYTLGWPKKVKVWKTLLHKAVLVPYDNVRLHTKFWTDWTIFRGPPKLWLSYTINAWAAAGRRLFRFVIFVQTHIKWRIGLQCCYLISEYL